MKDKPLIGITVSWQDEKRTYRNHESYSNMVMKAGGTPILLPYCFDGATLLDGILLTGGDDLPCNVGGYNDSPLIVHDSPMRNSFESWLFFQAKTHAIPVLGICRGCQLMSSLLGGNMYRDVPEAGFELSHNGESCFHYIETASNSTARLMFGKRYLVNSMHHQSIKTPGNGFIITARTDDGLIEIIEHEFLPMMGLQLHPERMDFLPPFTWLIESALRYMDKRL